MYYKINENQVIRREFFGGVAFDVDSYRNSAYSVLNDVAIDVLELIEYGLSISEIKTILKDIYEEDISEEIDDVVKQAISKGMISEAVEKKGNFKLDGFIKERSRILKMNRLSAPIIVSLNPTLKCNQLCDFCYVNNVWKSQYPDKLDFNGWKNLIDQLVINKIPLIDIVGGEPFAWRYMPDLLEYISIKPINFIISTNGTLITDELAKRLGKLKPSRFYLNVSLEDVEAERHDFVVKKKGAYDALMRSLGYLKKYNVNYGVNTVVNKRNFDRIEPLYNKLSDLGVPQLTLSFFHSEYEHLPDSPQEIEIIEFYEAYKRINALNSESKHKMLLSREGPFLWLCSDTRKISFSEGIDAYVGAAKLPPLDPFGLAFCECQMGKSRLDILPDGSVFPCILLTGRDDFLIGNLKNNSLFEIWNSERMEKISKYTPINSTPCVGCKFVEACKGGCFAYMLNRHRKQGSPDKRCPIVQRYNYENKSN